MLLEFELHFGRAGPAKTRLGPGWASKNQARAGLGQ